MKSLLTILFAMTVTVTLFAQAPVIQWQKNFGGTADEFATAIQLTKDGGYIITGPSDSDDSEVSGNHGATDYWVIKINDTGAIQWETSLGGNGDDNPYAVQQTADLGYIIAGGTSTSPASGDVACTVAEWDYWITKLSATGAITWTSCFGGSSYNVARSVQQTTDGGYIVAGTSSSNDAQVTGNHGLSDYWVVKLDDTGAIQWERSLGGSGSEICNNVQQTFDGGYIVGGYSNSTDGQVTGNHGADDYWIVKLDDTGTIQWEVSLGGAGDENCYSVRQTLDSGYIVAGSTDSASGEVTSTHGGQDYWVVKLNKSGAIQGERSFGGSGTDVANAVQQTTDSGYIVAGQTTSTNGDITFNFGGQDFWVLKLSPCLLDSPVAAVAGDTLSTAAAYSSYQWLLNGVPVTGATSTTYTATVNGTYNVAVSTGNGCTDTSAAVAVTSLGISTITGSPVIRVMPNPATDNITVTGAGPADISVYDIVGQLMAQAANTNRISVAGLPPGMYFIRITDNDGNILKQDKIIKQ